MESIGKWDNRINKLVMICLGVVGIGLVVYGLWEQIKPGEVKVEIVKSESQTTRSDLIYVDVAGAVEKSGVYKLQNGSRIGDALVAAGGMGANADREWMAKNLNLAKEVKDGEKVYVPDRSQIFERKGSTMVNINMASATELDKLEGIGEARAEAIIEDRPYGSIEELVSKAKIPQSVYEKIKTSISVY